MGIENACSRRVRNYSRLFDADCFLPLRQCCVRHGWPYSRYFVAKTFAGLVGATHSIYHGFILFPAFAINDLCSNSQYDKCYTIRRVFKLCASISSGASVCISGAWIWNVKHSYDYSNPLSMQRKLSVEGYLE